VSNVEALRLCLWKQHIFLNLLAFIVREISTFIRTYRQTDMARSTRLLILIRNINIYILYGQKRFLLPVTYFLTNLVLPFTLRVTGINFCDLLFKFNPNHRIIELQKMYKILKPDIREFSNFIC